MNKGKNVAKKKGLLLFVVLLNLVSSVIKSFKLLEHTSIHSKGSFTMEDGNGTIDYFMGTTLANEYIRKCGFPICNR